MLYVFYFLYYHRLLCVQNSVLDCSMTDDKIFSQAKLGLSKIRTYSKQVLLFRTRVKQISISTNITITIGNNKKLTTLKTIIGTKKSKRENGSAGCCCYCYYTSNSISRRYNYCDSHFWSPSHSFTEVTKMLFVKFILFVRVYLFKFNTTMYYYFFVKSEITKYFTIVQFLFLVYRYHGLNHINLLPL